MERTPADVIKEIGVATIAEALSARPRTIEMWRYRNILPRNRWPEITRAFPQLDNETLLDLEKRQGRAA